MLTLYTKTVLSQLLSNYHKLELFKKNPEFYIKQGTQYYPDLHPALDLLLKKVDLTGRCLDATGTLGVFSCQTKPQNGIVIDTSLAALTCTQANLQKHSLDAIISAAPIWHMPQEEFDTIMLTLKAEKGNQRVQANLQGLHSSLKSSGTAYVLMHKEQGAKRYEKDLKKYFKKVDVIAKDKGWRLSKVQEKRELEDHYQATTFDVLGLTLSAEVGVYASGKLDPGTAFLLETLDLNAFEGKQVLDLGCGYGLISLKASLAGSSVMAVDDDFLAVQSTHQNAKTYGLDICTLHSDINSELKEDSKFDVILSNPPFHIGKQVKLELPRAFIAAAHKHLVTGGEFLLVANKALAYEDLLKEFSYWESVAVNKQFKVLRAIK